MTTKRILLVLAALAVLGFGYYALSPLFRNVKADDALPEGAKEMQAPEATTTEQARDTEEPAKPTGAPVVDTPAHPASGTVRLVEASGKFYVRYENYKTINGPDIYVYLAKDLEAESFVNLGRVKATEGNVNYEIPSGVNPAEYRYVLTWCKAFGVLFNYADLGA